MNPLDIFTREDYQALQNARTKLGHAIAIIDKAKAVGIDVSEKEERRNQLAQILDLYEQHFFGPHHKE